MIQILDKPKVLFINPNPRSMSLLPPVIPVFGSIFKENGIEMKFFDTTYYDVTNKYVNPDAYKQSTLWVKKFDDKLEDKISGTQRTGDVFADFRNEVLTWKPDVIMCSAMESTVIFALEMLQSVRDLNIPHVMGGVFPTFAPDLALSFDEVDVVCKGEGEKVIVPLVQRLKNGESLAGIPNIVYNEDGKILRSPLAPLVDLNDEHVFTTEFFHDESRYYRAMSGNVYRMFPIETHRGCPHRCTFCNSPLQEKFYKEETGKYYFRKKSIANVMKDIEYLVNVEKAEYFFFWADNFLSYSADEIDEFCRAYSEYKIPFYAQSYPSTIDESKIKKMVDVGLHRLGMGVEHGNEEFRAKVINRRYSNQKAIRGVEILQKYDIEYSCNNIVGFPTETPELHMDTVRLNRALKAHTASCAIFTPFHGTPMRKLALDNGFLKDPDAIAPTNTETSVLDMPQFTKEQITGKSRTFNLYLKLPESRWHEVEQAEKLTPEGDRIWEELKAECSEALIGQA